MQTSHAETHVDAILAVPSLLVAMPHMQDPHFRKTVVLLAEHTETGALGFVVNRQGNVGLRDLVQLDEVNIPAHLPGWYGGPVETATGVVLHNQGEREADTYVADGVYLSATNEALIDMIEHDRLRAAEIPVYSPRPVLYPYRFVVGYGGWGPGQLNEEIRLGGWLQIPLDLNLLFNTPWPDMWDVALSGIGIAPSKIAPTIQSFLN